MNQHPYITASDGTRLFVRDWGQGRPVVFTHAWGLNADIWEYQMGALAEQGLRCVAFDRRGHGRSDEAAGGYDYDTLADDLAAVIEQRDLHDVTLVGYSMGCGEAVRYLVRHGSRRVARLALIGTVPPESAIADPDGFAAELRRDRPAFLAAGLPLFVGTALMSSEMGQWVYAQFMHCSARGAIACTRLVAAGRLRADFEALRVPTLLIHGTDDALNPLQQAAVPVAALIPGGRLRVYEGAPHGIVLTHRDRLSRDLRAYANGETLDASA